MQHSATERGVHPTTRTLGWAAGETNNRGTRSRAEVHSSRTSRYSSGHSVEDARQLAENFGIEFHIVPIKSPHDAYESTLGPIFSQNRSSRRERLSQFSACGPRASLVSLGSKVGIGVKLGWELSHSSGIGPKEILRDKELCFGHHDHSLGAKRFK